MWCVGRAQRGMMPHTKPNHCGVLQRLRLRLCPTPPQPPTQLPTSITSLAMCVRPLLLAGWHTADESTPQVRTSTRLV
jgi:hypothetical protein